MACIRKRRGKWVADWRDGAGIRRWKTFETKRDAEDFLDRERPQTRQWTRPVVDPGVTVAEYAHKWLDAIAATLKPRTWRRYHELVWLHVLPTLGETPLRRLVRGQVKALLTAKLAQEDPPLARNTVRNVHAVLRAMLRAAVEDGVLLANPAEKLGRTLRLVAPKATRQEAIKAMTREQRQQFLDAAARYEPRYFPLFATLAGTGMRLGEALALQWDDVDVARREIRVARALSQGRVQTPKSGHGRTVDISQRVAEILARLARERAADALRRGWRERPPWVFVNEAGHPLDDSKVRKVMTRVLKLAGLPPHFSPHCLRHTYASLLLQQGESIAYVQRQLGHASIQLTVDTYGKWLPLGSKRAVDRLDGIHGEASGSKMVAPGDGEAGSARVTH